MSRRERRRQQYNQSLKRQANHDNNQGGRIITLPLSPLALDIQEAEANAEFAVTSLLTAVPGPAQPNPNVRSALTKDAPRPGRMPNVPPPLVPVDPTEEYVAGGGFGWWGNAYAALSPYIDDLTATMGSETYEQMLKDTQIAKSMAQIKYSVLADGLQLTVAEVPQPELPELDPPEQADPTVDPTDLKGELEPAEPDAEQEAYDEDTELAQDIQEFCTRNLSNIRPPFAQTLFALLDAVAVGHKIAEKVWSDPIDDPTDQDFGRTVLKKVKVKPNRTVAFVVDIYQNVIGIEGLMGGTGMTNVVTGALIGNLTGTGSDRTGMLGNVLPLEKFVVFTNKPRDNDPRGTSDIRPAYIWWWRKQQIALEYMKYMARFASPGIVGTLAANLKPQGNAADGLGNVSFDSLGNRITTTSPTQAMGAQLAQFANGTWIVLPNGATVTPFAVSPGGDAVFLAGISQCDEQMEKSIALQTLASSNANTNARAASQTHQDIFDTMITFIKRSLEEVITQDVIYYMVLYNFGLDAARRLCPKFVLSKTEQHNFSEQASAISSLNSSGVLHPSQLPGVDAMLGLPARDTSQDAPPGQLPLDPNAGTQLAANAIGDPLAVSSGDAGNTSVPTAPAAPSQLPSNVIDLTGDPGSGQWRSAKPKARIKGKVNAKL